MKEDKKWRVEAFDDFISIRDESGDEVCYIDDFTDERKAMENAILIEAAPELYRLLKEAVDCIEYNFKGQDDVADFWIKEAKDALRIASGEKR